MRELFCYHWEIFQKSIEWLKLSFDRCKDVDFSDLDEQRIERLETFANRFSRSIDIFINKLLRSLDELEAEKNDRRLDSIIRAEKRGFVEDYEILLDLKNLRNELAHEYIEELFLDKMYEVFEASEKLFMIEQKVKYYINRYGYCK